MSNLAPDESQDLLNVGLSEPDISYYSHLRSKLTILTYIRIADEISRFLPAKGPPRILDWGAGRGQMSYLLRRRGYDVVSYIYQDDNLKDVLGVTNDEISFGEEKIPVTLSAEPVKLPFEDGYFDGVLSSGVLEHVQDENGSLDEIRRVLKPGGYLFVYQLPQKGSWMEFIIKRFKLGYWHERKYTARGARQLLIDHGYKIKTWRRANMLPKNFTGLPRKVKAIFEKQPKFVLKVDNALSHIPVVNYVSGILELIAYKA